MKRISEITEHYQNLVQKVTGAERAWAYRNWMLVSQGYYSSDELIDLSLHTGFLLEDPFTRVRRDTQIESDVKIFSGTVIDGENVRLGYGSILKGAIITASNVQFGQNNAVSGKIAVDNLIFGDNNTIADISGQNLGGQVVFGDGNMVREIKIDNPWPGKIIVGNYNELHPGLSLNCPFPPGWIRIGHYNSLGRDGGGVISSSYRFNNRWGGYVLIGSFVETTRGAEVLGFSVLGVPLLDLVRTAGSETELYQIFQYGRIPKLMDYFNRLFTIELDSKPGKPMIGLFGVAKVRRSCLVNLVKLRDDVRVQSSFLRNVWLQERCQVFFSIVNSDHELKVTHPGCVIEEQIIQSDLPGEDFPTSSKTEGYPESDYPDYEYISDTFAKQIIPDEAQNDR